MRKAAGPAQAPSPRAGQAQIRELYQQIRKSRVRMAGADGKARNLPASLDEFLARLARALGEGGSLAIFHADAQLTTVEAARILGVSRQFLVRLLENGEIPYHMTGTHRRIYLRDLLAYKARRDSRRRKILDDLARAEAQDGLYDLEPPGDPAR